MSKEMKLYPREVAEALVERSYTRRTHCITYSIPQAPKFIRIGITAAVATLVGYTTGLLYGFSLRVLFTGSLYGFSLRVLFTGSLYGFSLRVLFTGSLFGSFFGLFTRNYCTHHLSIYMGPVDPQVDHHQAIQSILCCAYITTLPVIFINTSC
jgi:hypothetical protein